MKPVRRTDSTSQSCSCTSCLYKSESEQPSIRKYVLHGSRIDRLYYGKYIPSRERKLLNRLVRTRAVYDDLRARLISDSTLSLDKNADLRPGKHRQVIKTLDSDKSGAILELVDIIDKGATLDPKKLSECCSCCSCSSKSKMLEGNNKVHKHKKAYARTYEEEHGPMEQAGTGEAIYTRTYDRKYGKTGQIGIEKGYGGMYQRVYDKTVPRKMRERYNKRGVRFKAKHIRSDPCTCTFKFSGLIKKHSKAMFKKIRPPLEEPYFDAEEQYVIETTKKQNLARKSFQKYKNLRDKLDKDIKKLNESKNSMLQNLQLHAKRSLEQVKQVKKKIKKNVESGVRKSVQAVKALHPKDKVFETVEYPEIETNFKIRKDSIIKFKDYLKRKEILKDWECDLECEPDTCVPEDCFKIIKLRRSQKRKRQHDHNRGTRYEVINREMKIGGIPLSKSDSGVQAEHFAMTTATHTKKHKPILRVEGKKQLAEKRMLYESKRVNKDGKKKRIKKVAKQSEESLGMPVKEKENTLPENKKKGYGNEKKVVLKDAERFEKKDIQQSRARQAVRISSSFSFDLEFHKGRPRTNTSLSSQPSGIYVHTPRHKDRKVYRRHKRKPLVLKPSTGLSQGTLKNTSQTRLIQTDQYRKVLTTSEQEQLESNISQCECKKRLSNVKINTDYATKSVASDTKSYVTTDKAVFKEVKQKGRSSQVSLLPARQDTKTSEIKENYPYKQAVRIGSTFSFNVEFYKSNDQNASKIFPLEETVKQTRSKNIHVGRKFVQIKGRSVKAYKEAKTTLHRCFCTLKLNNKPKQKTKKSKTASVTCLCESRPLGPSMVDKYVETKKKNRFEMPKFHLLPYECEPGICVPEQCDPIVCQKILNLRKQRFKRRISKSIGSYTGPRKTKSTSSIVSSTVASAKAKIVQSSIVPTKTGSTNAPRKYRETLYLGHNELIKPNINMPDRQAVRIGSSFSFNIEFYKDKHTPVVAVANKPSSSSMPLKMKQRKFEDKHDYKHSKPMYTQVINTDKYIRPSLKRCLCTLKLYKNKALYKKTYKKPTKLTVDTQTIGEIPQGETVNKGTKTKKEDHHKLLSYECEPFFCIPGECDPYICLQRIKKRDFHTRNISAFTDKPDMKSISSLTENLFQKSEAIIVQPKLLRKGVNAQSDYIEVLDGKSKSTGETFKTSKSKQAVRIGSSFKFSIEFKKQLPGIAALNNIPNIKPVSKDHPKLNKDKGITVTKVRVGHVDTQVMEPRKNHKSSLVRPMLKRCFCTLNLQNKTKQQYHKDLRSGSKYFGPKVYTVGRATTTKTEVMSHSFGSQIYAKLQVPAPKTKIISISTSSFLLNKYIKTVNPKFASKKNYSTFKTQIQLKEPVVIKSKLSMKIDLIRKLCLYKDSRISYVKPMVETFNHHVKTFDQQSYLNLKKNTSCNKFVEQCFCTMNVQISNQGTGVPGTNKKSKKLKAYECEPGICIPGECNPHECKKLIMRRFAKNIQRASGTDSKSVSSYTSSYVKLHSKNNQTQSYRRSHSQGLVPEQYRLQRPREPKKRQAVRIKSSFSFDLEFYKHHTQPFEKKINAAETSTNIEKHVYPKTYKTVRKGVQVKEFYGKDDKFNPAEMFIHKSTATMTKRCFCTLKLHKKGRIHREQEKINILEAKQPTTTLRNAKIGTTPNNDQISSNDLKLYECEPGICIPGECDPYLCLELMKNRKNFGMKTLQIKQKSVSSMTNEENKRKLKTRAVDTINKKSHHKSIRTFKHINDIQDNISYMSGRRSRPAVRIGSSFSFNIEFLKDFPQTQHYKQEKYQRVNLSNSDTKQEKNKKEGKKDISPSSKDVFHKATVTEKPENQDAMITASFMKRCFCTKNLSSTKVLNDNNMKTFKHKCLCLLGFKGKGNKKYQTVAKNDLQDKENYFKPAEKPPVIVKENKKIISAENRIRTVEKVTGKENKKLKSAEKPIPTVEKVTNTNYRQNVYLETYECEPGICIPGECNPHFCKKIIEKRLTKQYSKKSETESVRTHSVSSSFENFKKVKNERIQAQKQVSEKRLQSKSKSPLQEMPSNVDKRLVRIGSNFSFNIEFYKDNVNGSVIKDKVREVKMYPTKNVRNQLKDTSNISKRIETETVSVRSNKLRVKKIQTNKPQVTKRKNVTNTSPLLKRCFCTLKLSNKPVGQNKKKHQLEMKPTTKSAETQSYKSVKGQSLQNEVSSPYECEPFVCVPGECNPAECLNRILKRRQKAKDSGTITNYPKRKSIGSVANKKKDENIQIKRSNPVPKKNIQKSSYVHKTRPEMSYDQPRRAVRLGSNFSFNIEFFKDIANDLPKTVQGHPLQGLNVENSKDIAHQHTKSQPSYFQHNLGSQVKTTKMQSAETTMTHLKRCFCTLPLKNRTPSKHQNTSIKIQTQSRSDQSSARDFFKKCICTLKFNKVGKHQKELPVPAVKYEIKGTSTAIRVLPQDRVKKLINPLEPYECEPYVCVPGNCNPYECLKRIQKRQVRNFGTDYKRNIKDSATDSIQQPETKSTKAQYHQKRKINSRGTSVVPKRTRGLEEIGQFSSYPYNTNRRVVRIGSNFSFNVEFFKDHLTTNTEPKEFKPKKVSNIETLHLKRQVKPPTKKGHSVKRLNDKKSQCSIPKTQDKGPTAKIAPKRCFCTLKLLNKPNNSIFKSELLSTTTKTKDKMTATKIKHAIPQELGVYECPPLMCIPGQCNPYECFEKIKRKEVTRKSRNVGTRPVRTQKASVGNHGLNLKVRKVQSHVEKERNVITSTAHSEPQAEILKSSRFIENRDPINKRAVRIGSNFKFNVEFFKQNSQPDVITIPKIVKARSNEEDSPYLNKHVTAETRNYRHYNSYMDNIKLKDQASDTGNLLKRCFCTLQLQKRTRQKKPQAIRRPEIIRYPQTFTVGRVAVEPFLNNKSKNRNIRSISINTKLPHRTIGTKMDKKYLRTIEFPSSQCNPSNCPDYQKRTSRKNTDNADMQTILPYTPSKFNKKESKTHVSKNNTFNTIQNAELNRGVPKRNDISMSSAGKRRLTAKKSEKSIPADSMGTKTSCKSSFFCRCIRFLSRKTDDSTEENLTTYKLPKESDATYQPAQIKLIIPPKKAKSFRENCPSICPKDAKEYLKLQNGDVAKSKLKARTKPKNNDIQSKTGGKFESKHPQMRVTFADTSEYSKNNNIPKRKINNYIHSKSRLCYSCSVNDCPLKSNNLKANQQKSGDFKSLVKSSKKVISYPELTDDCQYCECCKRKIDTDEISKGGGDRRSILSSKFERNSNACPCGKDSIINGYEKNHSLTETSRATKLSQKHYDKTGKCCSKVKPFFEMRLDSVDHGIINKSEVSKKITQLSINGKETDDRKPDQIESKHRDECICCKCQRKRRMAGAKISVAAKGAYNILSNFRKILPKRNVLTKPVKRTSAKPSTKYTNPCICGSKKCVAELKRKRKTKLVKGESRYGKTCECGSGICSTESKILKRKKARIINKAKRKVETIIDKREREALKKRIRIQEEKDEIRRRKRIKRNKELEDRVKKYKNAGDLMLAIDSLGDVAKLGVSTLTGALRYTSKTFLDPKVSCERLCKKCRKKDPDKLMKQLHKDYKESDAASTLRRLKMRCLFMKRVQSLKQRLEDNPVTHFILHIADKNAKTRQFKRRPVRRVREPLDFQCSLYMATLRKRPYLSVYYKWPWFYPHFITMLNIWRQFTDIMLFLLAAVVWSPCILCMEGCRALMCCFFCTG